MAVVKVKMIGTGINNDPFRAPLPTYKELLTDYADGTVLAFIPDDDLHDKPSNIDPNSHDTSYGKHVLTLDESGHKAWHDHLDNRYKERKGDFRPEVV